MENKIQHLNFMLGAELDYLPNFKSIVSVRFQPQALTGGCGGTFPPVLSQGGLGGESTVLWSPPLAVVQGQCPRNCFFKKNAL